jgi:short-subunit dehydrogenase
MALIIAKNKRTIVITVATGLIGRVLTSNLIRNGFQPLGTLG